MRKEGIQTAVAGVSGYAGMELARLLLHHPALQGRPPVFVGRDAEPVRLTDMHPQLADNNGSSGLTVEPFSWKLLQERGVDLLFLATPHEQSRSWAPEARAVSKSSSPCWESSCLLAVITCLPALSAAST